MVRERDVDAGVLAGADVSYEDDTRYHLGRVLDNG